MHGPPPLAVRATASNRVLNHRSEQQLQVGPGSVETLIDQLAGRRADLLLCNILAPVIEALAPGFDELLNSRGRALLSGLLVDQAPRLIEVLNDLGWESAAQVSQGRWSLLEIRRR